MSHGNTQIRQTGIAPPSPTRSLLISSSRRVSRPIFTVPTLDIQSSATTAYQRSKASCAGLQSMLDIARGVGWKSWWFSKQIAHNAITILINLSDDKEILEYLAKDEEFIKQLLGKLTVISSLYILGVSANSDRVLRNRTRIWCACFWQISRKTTR